MPDPAPRSPPPAVLLCANTLKYLWKARGGLIQALQDLGFHVICAGEPDHTIAALQAMDCAILALPWTDRVRGSFNELGVIFKLAGLMRRRRPVAAFGFAQRPNFTVGVAARLAGVPYVTTVTNLGADFLRPETPFALTRQLHSLTNASAYATVFHNPGDLAQFRRSRLSTGRRTQVLPGSGVNPDRFPFTPLRRPVSTFVMIARLARDKGVAEYLEAAERLKRERPSLRFLLVGPPPAGDEPGLSIRDVAAFGSAVEYLGEVQDVRPILMRADCLVLPSYREGMPRVVLEAAAMGRICVVSDVEGCRDAILPDKTGLLCEARSSSSLAEALRRVARLRPPVIAAMSRQARELAVGRFDERFAIDAYLSMAIALAGERGPLAALALGSRSDRPIRAGAR